MNRYIFITSLFFLFSPSGFSQNHELDSLKKELHYRKTDSSRYVLLREISRQYAKENFDSAYFYARQHLKLAERNQQKNQIIEAYKNISYAYDYQYEIDSTLVWYRKALLLAEKTGNLSQMCQLYNHIGIAHFYKGAYDQSLENLYKALNYSEQINDSTYIAKSCNNIAYILNKQDNPEKALDFLKRALAINEKIASESSLIPALFNISSISFKNKAFDEGKAYLTRALNISKKIKDTTYIAISYSYLAIAHARHQHLPESMYYLQQSLQLKDKIKDKYHYGQLLYDLAAVYANLNSFEEAEKLFLESININRSVRPELVAKSYKELAHLYQKNKNFEQALIHYKRYTQLNDSLFNIQKDKAIKDIETRYETAKKEKEISSLKAYMVKEKMNRKFWIWVSVLSILLAGTFIYFFYHSRKKSLELVKKNAIIQKTLAEKNVLFKEVHHRVKNNLQVISSILSLQIRYLKEPIAIEALKDSQRRIDSISLIHQKLYKKDKMTGIDMKDFVDDLVYNIIDSMRIDNRQIEYKPDIDENLVLEVDTVTPIGLILNELIINSIKHNKDKHPLLLEISLKKENNLLVLQVKDNGKGIDGDFDYLQKDSYGMKMIASLSKKLKAGIRFINQEGLLVRIEIQKYKEIEK